MAAPTLADRFSIYAMGLKYEDLPAQTVHEVKRRLLDSFGCALGAYDSDPARIARTVAKTVTSANPATVIGTTYRSSPELAAFSNGVHFRYLDYNDTYLSLEPAHPSDNFAAVLAAGESVGANGRDIVTAAVLAYEIQCRLCDAASIRARGWDHVTYGSFSTSLAAGKLFGLSAKQLTDAQGLAGVPNNAMRQTRVGMLSNWKGCAFANASRNGVFAATLAREGLTGPSEVFEGEMGFFKQVSGPFEIAALGGNGEPFVIDRTYIKFFPAEYHSQSAIDAALVLRKQIPDLGAIESITIETFDAAVQIIGGEPEKWRPTTRETADHSLPYCVAAALLEGKLTLESFDKEHLADTRIHDLLGKTKVVEDPVLSRGYPDGIPNRVSVKTRDGAIYEKEVTHPRGHAKNPMTDEEVVAKFRRLAEPLLHEHRIDAIVERCWNLDSETDLTGLLNLLIAS